MGVVLHVGSVSDADADVYVWTGDNNCHAPRDVRWNRPWDVKGLPRTTALGCVSWSGKVARGTVSVEGRMDYGAWACVVATLVSSGHSIVAVALPHAADWKRMCKMATRAVEGIDVELLLYRAPKKAWRWWR